MADAFDVLIVGGGLVGASLAVAIGDVGLRVALVEASAPPQSVPAWDERCIAINDGSVSIFRSLGVWDALSGDGEPILATHISERGRFGVARFTAVEAQLDALGYNVPLRAIGAALWSRLQGSGTRIYCPARVVSVETDAESSRLRIESGGGTAGKFLTGRLLVAADGAQSAVRRHLGLGAEARDYAQSAIVSAVRTARAHLGVAYERFTPEGPLALIPKPGSAASLVWTLPAGGVREALALTDADYLQRAEETFGGRLGRFLGLGRRSAYPLSRVVATRATATRCLMVGNAAQSLHPVAAQGFNLGLRDVAVLAASLREAAQAGHDPGAEGLLAGFAAARAADRSRVSGFTDFIVRAFSNRIPGLMQARHLGIVAADLLPGVREQLLRQHLGHLGLSRGLLTA